MVEVFKTNVSDPNQAIMILEKIHKNFAGYQANFDLEDTDRILRVKSANGVVQSSRLIDLLCDYGFNAEVLPDDYFPVAGNEATSQKVLSKCK
jgi:hypothetical protein